MNAQKTNNQNIPLEFLRVNNGHASRSPAGEGISGAPFAKARIAD